MITVGIVGCGKIADDHVALIRSRSDREIVAVCDREELMAGQLAERYKIPGAFSDVQVMLDRARPDVVHVTTPPQSHCAIAKQCLLADAHVFVEKPFTVNAGEAVDLIRLAEQRRRKITVHHEQQFTRPARHMRELIRQGYLGGPPVHIESYYGYDLGQGAYAKALLSDKSHWVRQLPGGLLQNVISHGVAKIAEFLPTDAPTVVAHGFPSALVKGIDEGDIIDELRVIVSDHDRFTAYFTFSSRFRPCLHLVRVYGPANAIEVDHDQQTILRVPGSRYKIFLEKIIPSFLLARQHAGNCAGNVWRFIRRDLPPKGGSLYLMNSFYDSVIHDTEPPISYREIILTVRLMDEIFEQIQATAVPQPAVGV